MKFLIYQEIEKLKSLNDQEIKLVKDISNILKNDTIDKNNLLEIRQIIDELKDKVED